MVVYMLREICYEKWKEDEEPFIKSIKFSRFNSYNTANKHLRAFCNTHATAPSGVENPMIKVEMGDDTARIIDTTMPVTRIYNYRIIKIDEPDGGIFVGINNAVAMYFTH